MLEVPEEEAAKEKAEEDWSMKSGVRGERQRVISPAQLADIRRKMDEKMRAAKSRAR